MYLQNATWVQLVLVACLVFTLRYLEHLQSGGVQDPHVENHHLLTTQTRLWEPCSPGPVVVGQLLRN